MTADARRGSVSVADGAVTSSADVDIEQAVEAAAAELGGDLSNGERVAAVTAAEAMEAAGHRTHTQTRVLSAAFAPDVVAMFGFRDDRDTITECQECRAWGSTVWLCPECSEGICDDCAVMSEECDERACPACAAEMDREARIELADRNRARYFRLELGVRIDASIARHAAARAA